jgi:8-hydroxy-5-deazaflavin:NADPH oxidoreductase
MRIAVVGRGSVGGGLADLWEKAGHEVTRSGRGGGDVSGADAVLLAVPSRALAAALDGATGIEGKTVIDATNLVGHRPPDGFASNAEYVKSRTGGPTAKSFNTNFAVVYDHIAAAQHRPANLWCGDAEARDTVEQLSRDAGFEPLSMGRLESAALQETVMQVWFAINEAGLEPFFYRMATPDRF